jgi:phage shock protein A
MRSSTAKDTDTALEELREATKELTSDYDGLATTIARARARVAEFEVEAMEAIRRGEDVAAREALLRQQKQTASLDSLLADAAVVRAMIDECERILDGRGRWS